MTTQDQADALAADWVAAWNAHDLDAILAHYADDVIFASPFVAALTGEKSGIIRGREALSDYFRRALDAYPDLRFELHAAVPGASSIALHYTSVGGRPAIETMELDGDGRVCRVAAHYGPAVP
jgi:ketosteroid isomerase-like protein